MVSAELAQTDVASMADQARGVDVAAAKGAAAGAASGLKVPARARLSPRVCHRVVGCSRRAAAAAGGDGGICVGVVFDTVYAAWT